MRLLDYHRLRREEQDAWDAERAEYPLPQAVLDLLPSGSERFSDDLCDIARGPLFEKLAALSRLYLESSPQQRVSVRSSVAARRRAADLLQSFGLRAAVIALRENSIATLETALAAFAIADIAGDVRDTLMSVSVLFHVAKRIAPDAERLFQETAGISGPAMAAVLTDFAKRPKGLQTLACMGWREVETPHGPGFQWGRRRSSQH